MRVAHTDPRERQGKTFEMEFWVEMEMDGRTLQSRPRPEKLAAATLGDARRAANMLDTAYAAAIDGLSPKEASAKLAELVAIKLMVSATYNQDGSAVTIRFDDGSEETRYVDASGLINMRDLWFRDATTGEITQWGEDGAYETPNGFVVA